MMDQVHSGKLIEIGLGYEINEFIPPENISKIARNLDALLYYPYENNDLNNQ